MSNQRTFPGFIDNHVHFREPGFPDKATMATEAKAARAGGVLTVVDMPNTNPPTVTVEALEDAMERASRVKDIDIRFFFGATEMEHVENLRTVWMDEHLRKHLAGVKLFFDHSTGNQKADTDVIEAAFALCAELDIPMIGHCEDPAMNDAAAAKVDLETADVSMHSVIRPAESEAKSIEYAIGLSRTYGAPFHVAHLSTEHGVDLVRSAKQEGLRITCEACPHHLFLTTEDYSWLGTFGKMNPPLRSEDHRDALWEGIADGTVDCIATDHAPHTSEEKKVQPPLSAPSGVPGVRTMIPLLLTVASGRWPHPVSTPPPAAKSFTYDDIERCSFANPNTIFRLNASSEPRVTVDLDHEWELVGSSEYSKCGWTPYEGWKVTGHISVTG